MWSMNELKKTILAARNERHNAHQMSTNDRDEIHTNKYKEEKEWTEMKNREKKKLWTNLCEIPRSKTQNIKHQEQLNNIHSAIATEA